MSHSLRDGSGRGIVNGFRSVGNCFLGNGRVEPCHEEVRGVRLQRPRLHLRGLRPPRTHWGLVHNLRKGRPRKLDHLRPNCSHQKQIATKKKDEDKWTYVQHGKTNCLQKKRVEKKTEWQKVSRPIETAFQKLLIIGHEIATIYYQRMHLLIWKPISFQDMHLRT